MRMQKEGDCFFLYKEKEQIGRCSVRKSDPEIVIADFCILPEQRGKGYGTWFLKELLRSFGGYDRSRETCFSTEISENERAVRFFEKAGFAAEGDRFVRRRRPDLSAVEFSHRFLSSQLHEPELCIDATCGNGLDTLFLCGLSQGGKVIALDIQPSAAENTRRRLEESGIDEKRFRVICADHAELDRYAGEGTADAVLFNFGWLPGADHSVHSQAEGSLSAVRKALKLLRHGGILSAVLYSGKVIGSTEKEALLAFFEALPLTEYTVLICRFANWADTAPLPCFVIRR